MAERLTISDVATYPRPGMDAPGMIGFSPDSSAVNWLHAAGGGLVRSLWRIDVQSRERSVVAGPGADAPMSREEELLRERTRTRELGVASYSWARESDVPVLMIPGPTVRNSVDGEPLRELSGTEGALTPTLSPDGTQLSFVRDGELFVIDTDGQDGCDAADLGCRGRIDPRPRRLHRSGRVWSAARPLVVEGWTDCLPAGRRAHVAPYPIVHQGATDVDVETHRYPFAGDENAHVSLWVVDVASGKHSELPLPEEDGYLVRIAWWPDSSGGPRLVAQWIDREQKQLRLMAFSDSGQATTLIDETQEPWINVADDARGLADGTFLWSSESSGYRHLSLRAADGTEICRLTEGEWIVDGVIGVDEDLRWVYFSSTLRVADESPC